MVQETWGSHDIRLGPLVDDEVWVSHLALKVLFTDASGGGSQGLSGENAILSFLDTGDFGL